jgi:hypothetical protein
MDRDYNTPSCRVLAGHLALLRDPGREVAAGRPADRLAAAYSPAASDHLGLGKATAAYPPPDYTNIRRTAVNSDFASGRSEQEPRLFTSGHMAVSPAELVTVDK